MVELLRLYLKSLLRAVATSRWLPWTLGVSFIVVLAGLIPILRLSADPLAPFGVPVLDLLYAAALGVLLLGFTPVFVPVVGIFSFRYNGALLVLLGAGVFGYQIYGFVRFDEWQSFALRDLTDALLLTLNLGQSTGWAKAILREFLEQTPVSMFLIFCGAMWHVGAKKLLDRQLRDLQDAESRRLKPITEARPRPKLATSPGHWIPVRLYRRKTGEPAPPAYDARVKTNGAQAHPLSH